MIDPDRRYTDEQVALILRRAAQLDAGSAAPDVGDGLTLGEIERIARLPARKIPQVLGYSNGDEVIHRDDLVLLDASGEGADPAAGAGHGGRGQDR